MQSAYFCKVTNTQLILYIPETKEFLMYFKNKVLTIALDSSFVNMPNSAIENAAKIALEFSLDAEFLKLKAEDHTAKTPVLPTAFNYMCCPRTISDLTSKISLGHIGSNVRGIINNAVFPILMPSPVFKKWTAITAFFGGSRNSFSVLELSVKLSKVTGMPLNIFTFAEGKEKDYYQKLLAEKGILANIENKAINWIYADTGKFLDNLFSVPHDSLVVIGSYGHGILKDLLFGSKMEATQTHIPNNLLIVGSHYTEFE